MENMENNEFIKSLNITGEMPKDGYEVLMTARGAISLLAGITDTGDRLMAQFESGEISDLEVMGYFKNRLFIVAEMGGYFRTKVTGIISDDDIYEERSTFYHLSAFDKELKPKHDDGRRKVKIYKDSPFYNAEQNLRTQVLAMPDIKGLMLDDDFARKTSVVYNKIHAFISMSQIGLLVIAFIASVSAVSLLGGSVFERRCEIGIYRSTGYDAGSIYKILFAEFAYLFLAAAIINTGLFAGVFAATSLHLNLGIIIKLAAVIAVVFPILVIASVYGAGRMVLSEPAQKNLGAI